MNVEEFEKGHQEFEKSGFPGLCVVADRECSPSTEATCYIKLSDKEIYLYCDAHRPSDAVALHPSPIAQLLAPPSPSPSVSSGAAARTAGSATGFAKLRSMLTRQFGIRLQSTGDAANVAELSRVILQTFDASPENPYLVEFDQLILDPFTGPAQAVLSTNLTGTNNDLVFTAVATGVEGNGITVSYVDPVAPSIPLSIEITGKAITITLATDGAGVITTIASDIAALNFGDLVTVANKAANNGTGLVTAMGAALVVGDGQFDLVERDLRRRVFDGTSAGGTPVLGSETMNWQPGDASQVIKVGIYPGRLYRILSVESPESVTLDRDITLPSTELILTMDGSVESEVTIATKDGFAGGTTAGGHSHLLKAITVDKVYSVVFVPGTAGDGIFSVRPRGLYPVPPDQTPILS